MVECEIKELLVVHILTIDPGINSDYDEAEFRSTTTS